jgi:signal transduction histidine kinase/iron only hydrogenase large subunit-like protein
MQPVTLVTTIKERCRVCYTCVRECPAKAIRIAEGQAEVIPERCIGCGNCVRMCSQHAKLVLRGIDDVHALLKSGVAVAACLAPSFPAEFEDVDYRRVVAMVRKLGFAYVNEVAFGADLVAAAYRKLLASARDKRFIATTCPAIVGYVERYYPALADSLAPVVSPMVATSRVLKKLHGSELRVVFIGPCIAKKGEVRNEALPGELDAALTFVELREMLSTAGITADSVEPSEFDEPIAGMAGLFPVSHGMLEAAKIDEGLIAGQVVAAEGRTGFVEAIREFEDGTIDSKLLEILCCNGCIMGAGMSSTTPLYGRRSRVSRYVRNRLATFDRRRWEEHMARFADLDLGRKFVRNDLRAPMPYEDDVAFVLAKMGKFWPEDELNCGACGYDTCREHAVAICKGLAESEMCLPYTIDQLKKTVKELAISSEQLATAQAALMQSEKLASMGQLAAGIAHEVNNPLGVVLMYSHLLLDGRREDPKLCEDLTMIAEQADRCKKIVAGLLHFARQNKVVLQETDVKELVQGALKSIPIPANVIVRFENNIDDPMAEVDRDQIIQVMTNLVSNAVAAMPQGGALTIGTAGDVNNVRISVTDTGVGIARENLRKIFEPFFTTKQIGKGTGLGLAVTYGVVKMHRGDIDVKSNPDPAAGATGTTFTVTLPRASERVEGLFKEADLGDDTIG